LLVSHAKVGASGGAIMNSAIDEGVVIARSTDADFFGHPRGLAYLVSVEGFWAFAYFGLQALLTLYLTHQLLLPGHIEHVLGFSPYRRVLEGGGPTLSPLDIASQTYGLMTSLAYALPLLGAFVADRWLGQRRTMVLGLIVLAVAMAVMVTEQGFLVAIGLIILGTGLLKCNLMVQIGRLYAAGDVRRTTAFAYYLVFANIGSFSAPLIAGTLAEKVSFRSGLVALAIGMTLALVTYLAGQAYAPRDTSRAEPRAAKAPPLHPHDFRIALVPVAALVPEVLYFGAYNQAFNIFPVWAADHVQRSLFGLEMPVTWFSTLDGILTIIGAVLAIRVWGWLAQRGRPMGDMARMAVGAVMGVLGFGLLAAAARSGAGKAPLWAGVGFFLFVDLAIPWVDTVTMALVSRAAPASINATMMGVFGLSVALGYYVTGQLGRLFVHFSSAAFWAIHAGLCVACLAFLALAGPHIARALASPASAPSEAILAA
jgi:POT family proton-dependent oligopeptide transporter